MEATEQQLIKIKGKGKARQISAMLKLAKILTSPKEERYSILSPKDVFNLLESDFRYEQKEHFICLFLNTKNRLIFKEIISIGSLNVAIVHPREYSMQQSDAVVPLSFALITIQAETRNHPLRT